MTKAFNLLEERWIPVRARAGDVRDVGLIELFEHAHSFAALAETSPPNVVALYRMLLAITHRALSVGHGPWRDVDRVRWYREGLPGKVLHDYLETWRDRFWLFHPEYPFMQVAALADADETRDKCKPWTQIALDSTNGNTPVVFDHAVDMQPAEISAPAAVRNLLGFLQFTPGGLVKAIRDSDKAGAVANTAAIVPLGASLSETLCLALHPWAQRDDDLPAWEQPAVRCADLQGAPTAAMGTNDRYTRRARAVLFLPEVGGTTIRTLRFAAGLALADDPNAPDPMASYRIGSNGPVRLTFNEGRAVWRDLPSIVPDAAHKAAIPSAVVSWAANLYDTAGDWGAPVALMIGGIASDQAKLLRWRLERIVLPAALLEEPESAEALRRHVRFAEETYFRMRAIAADMLAAAGPDPGSKDARARARTVHDHGPCAATFFAIAERHLPELMQHLAAKNDDQADVSWSRALAGAVREAWVAACRCLGQSAAAIRAEALAYPKLKNLLRLLEAGALTQTEGVQL